MFTVKKAIFRWLFFVCVNGGVEYNAAEIIQNKKSMKQKIIFIILLLLAVVVCLWPRWDERIDPRVLKWHHSEISYHSNYTQEPYFNLLGLNAADRFSALNIGRYRYHQDWSFSLFG